ncbi:hypothetical protein S245_045023, partial [Arachis hypogaea]
RGDAFGKPFNGDSSYKGKTVSDYHPTTEQLTQGFAEVNLTLHKMMVNGRGLQPLMTHAKTKGSKRVKIHMELAKLLDEELCRRGTSVIPPGEAFGKWKGFKVDENDHEIVWPPMVIIQNLSRMKMK